MAGFGSLGGLGGRPGGFGTSYPSRGGSAPVSQTVRQIDSWGDDLQSRLASAQQRSQVQTVFNPGPADNPRPTPMGPSGDYVDYTGVTLSPTWGSSPTDFGPGPGPRPDAPTADPNWVDTTGISTNWGAPSSSGPQVFNDTPAPPFDWTALNREKAEYDRTLEAGQRNQQAYDWMSGGGQINGIIGPEYTNPYFNQIGAQAGQIPEGTDMDWAADVYRPGDTYTAPRANSKGWNFW